MKRRIVNRVGSGFGVFYEERHRFAPLQKLFRSHLSEDFQSISTWFLAPTTRWDAIVSFVEIGIILLIPILFDFTFFRVFKEVKSMIDSASNSEKMSIDDYRIIAINGYLIRDAWLRLYNVYINRLSFVVEFFSANHSLLHHYWFFSSFHLLIRMPENPLASRFREFRLDSHKPTVTISPLTIKGTEFRNWLDVVTASTIQDEDLTILQNIYDKFRMKYSSQDCREKFDGQYEHEGVVVSEYEKIQYDKSTDAIMCQEMLMQRQAPPVYRRSTMMKILARRPTNSRRCYFECDNYWIREISLRAQYKNYRFTWIVRRLIHVYEVFYRFRSISYVSTMYVSILNLLVILILLDHTFH